MHACPLSLISRDQDSAVWGVGSRGGGAPCRPAKPLPPLRKTRTPTWCRGIRLVRDRLVRGHKKTTMWPELRPSWEHDVAGRLLTKSRAPPQPRRWALTKTMEPGRGGRPGNGTARRCPGPRRGPHTPPCGRGHKKTTMWPELRPSWDHDVAPLPGPPCQGPLARALQPLAHDAAAGDPRP